MESFIARQPIFDTHKNVVAYELLFRDGTVNANAVKQLPDGTQASYHVMTNALTLFGMEKMTSGKRAFINTTGDVLIGQLPTAFSPQSIVIEILEDVPAEPEILDACRQLKQQGYTIAMDDVIHGESRNDMVVLSDIIKIDFMDTTPAEQAELARQFDKMGKTLLAEKVETHDVFEYARKLGFTLFQGYFFARPEVLVRKEIRANKLNSLRLITRLQTTEPDIGALEDIVKNDVAMSYRLLRYINSAFFSFRREIESIRQAIVLLGNREFRKWATLIAMSGLTDDKPEELLVTGLIRARFLEQLAGEIGFLQEKDNLFLMGVFSILDGATDQPFEIIFDEIPVHPAIREALLTHSGPFAPVMTALWAFEKGDWSSFSQFINNYVELSSNLTEMYFNAVLWANQSMAAIPKKMPHR
ncbi:MAG: HDOD domain-containing protein [Deltaproteobacteria bacterium]|nr:HDOD domain-containing protein [Deltaproteobacteria bacterium]